MNILVTKKDLSKDERIKKEIRRLTGLFRKMGENTKKVVASLIANAAFMSVTLEELQAHINENGVTDEYQNGANQFGTKKSPQVEVHIAMTKNHIQVMKQLTDLLPKPVPNQEGDGFDDFISRRDDM